MNIAVTADGVEQAAAFVSAVFVLGGLVAWLIGVYQRTVGQRRTVAAQVERLTGGIRYAYVEELLGTSKFRRDYDGVVEDTFVLGPAYVQTLTDSTGTVLMVAVTSSHPRFHPQFWVGGPGGNPAFKVTLGKTMFGSVTQEPSGSVTLCGARRFAHLESFDIGNPGNYQTFILGYNDAGCGSFGSLPDLLGSEPCIGYGDLASRALEPTDGLSSGDQERIQAFRDRTVVNTFAVTMPLFELAQLVGLPIGADLDTVRVLPATRLRARIWIARVGLRRKLRRFISHRRGAA